MSRKHYEERQTKREFSSSLEKLSEICNCLLLIAASDRGVYVPCLNN